MEEGLSPAPATTAEEAMASSGESAEREPAVDLTPPHRPSSGETRGPAGMAAAGREDSGAEVEPWAASVPPVRSVTDNFSFEWNCHSLNCFYN